MNGMRNKQKQLKNSIIAYHHLAETYVQGQYFIHCITPQFPTKNIFLNE